MIKIYNKNGVILNTKDKYCTENIEIAVDSTNLTPENIVKGKVILGVSGTAEGGTEVIPDGYIKPTGTITITENGIVDITTYASAEVNVPIPDGYIKPEGDILITENGVGIPIAEYKFAYVNVPVPEGYIIPSGNFEIVANGNYNISDKETVSVNVPTGGGGDSLWGSFFGGKVAGKNLSYTFAYSDITDVSPYLAGYNTSAVTDMKNMFHNCKNLTTVPLFDTSNVTNMYQMFTGCSNLPTIPQFNTSKVTDMSYMFQNCSALTSAPQLDTSKVPKLGNYFNYCVNLEGTAVVNTDSATDIASMFAQCHRLKRAEISSMDKITSQYSAGSYASGCYNLRQFIIRNMTKVPIFYNASYGYPFNDCYHFEGTYHDTYNPEALQDGGIYVPDEWVEPMKAATGWSMYGDVIYPLSQLPESYEITDRPYIKNIEKAGSYTTFSYNTNGYYCAIESSSRASKFNFVVPENATKKSIKFEVEIVNNSTTYAYGIFKGFLGKLDTEVTSLGSNLQESDCELYLDSISVPAGDKFTYTVVYDNLPAGEHFINIGANTKAVSEFRVRVTYE